MKLPAIKAERLERAVFFFFFFLQTAPCGYLPFFSVLNFKEA